MAAPSTPEAPEPGSPPTLNLTAKKRKIEKKVLGSDDELIAASHLKVDALGAPTGRFAAVVKMPNSMMGPKHERHLDCWEKLQEGTLQSRMEETWSKSPWATFGGYVLDIDTAAQYQAICDEIKDTSWGEKLIVQSCIPELLEAKPKLNFFYSENEDYFKITGTKTAYPFKPWLEQLKFKYQGGDANTRHFANKTMKSEDKEHYTNQLDALCKKWGWQLVAW